MNFVDLVLSLQELCCRAIVARTSVYAIEQLPLPVPLKSCLKSYSSTTNYYGTWRSLRHFKSPKDKKTISRKAKAFFSCDSISKALSSSTPLNNSQLVHHHSHHRNKFCSIS